MIVFYEDLLKIEFMDEDEFCEKFGIEDDYWHWVAEDGDIGRYIHDFNIPWDAIDYIRNMARDGEISYNQAYELFDIICEKFPELEYDCYI